MSIAESWERIVEWYQKNTPRGTFAAAKGAPEKQIAKVESTLGQPLPADLRESYLLHNGTAGKWLLYFGELMPIDGIERKWKGYLDLQKSVGYGLGSSYKTRAIKGPIKPIWWSPLRIPITENGGGDPVMVDLDPPKAGKLGQILEYSHEVGPECVLASSFAKWFAEIADDLEAGKYVYNKEERTVAPPGMYD